MKPTPRPASRPMRASACSVRRCTSGSDTRALALSLVPQAKANMSGPRRPISSESGVRRHGS
ncbi:MAG: hypothetical protein GW913_03810 [Myxococcales bacterium]|nr:hypothetical protein [Myxococcales bacterium]